MKFFAIISALTAVVTASPIAEVVERGGGPDPAQIKIKSVAYAGSGCPPKSATVGIYEEGSLVSIRFSDYTAQTGGKAQPKDARKNCNVIMELDYPSGWSYSVATTLLRGEAYIPKSCKATLAAQYFWSGRRDEAKCEATFKGHYEDEYTTESKVNAEVWSSCRARGKSGPPFNINTSAKIDCKKEARLNVDAQDTEFKVKLNWRRC